MAVKNEMRAKALVSGDVVELKFYSVPITCGERPFAIKKRDKDKLDEEIEKRNDNLYRARQNVRRIIWSNQTKFTKFLTLTYADTVLDVKKVRRNITTFVQAMRRKGYDMKYLYVLEHQKKRGEKEGNEGCLHVHMLIFIDKFIPLEVLLKCWKHGSVEIEAIDYVNNLGAYVCKYITKDNLSAFGSHTYECSQGLNRPTEERFYTLGYSDTDTDFYPEDVLQALNVTFKRKTRYDFLNDNGTTGTQTVTTIQGTWKDKNIIQERDPLHAFARQIDYLHSKENK